MREKKKKKEKKMLACWCFEHSFFQGEGSFSFPWFLYFALLRRGGESCKTTHWGLP